MFSIHGAVLDVQSLFMCQLAAFFRHHLSEVQNDYDDTTCLGSVHCVSCSVGHVSSLLTGLSRCAVGECRTKDLG